MIARVGLTAFVVAAVAGGVALLAAGRTPGQSAGGLRAGGPPVGRSHGLVANVWVARTGDDGCRRSGRRLTLARASRGGHVCRHWDAAYRAASSASRDLVRVVDGTYESTWWRVGAIDHHGDLDSFLLRDDPAKRSGRVTFACGTPGSRQGVTFAHQSSIIEADRVTIDGGGNWRRGRPSCFRFRSVLTGWLGDATAADRFVLRGVHASAVVVVGSHGARVERDEIGPAVSCHDSHWPVAAERCRPIAADDEAYAHARDEGTAENSPTDQTQYTAAGSCRIFPRHLVWRDDWFHDSNGLGDHGAPSHTGQLQNGGSPEYCPVRVDHLTFARDRFERNIVAGIAPVAGEDHVRIENNWFGPGAEPATEGRCVPAVSCPRATDDPRSIDVATGWGGTGRDWLIRFNTLADPTRLGGPIRDGRIVGNIFMASSLDCGAFAYRADLFVRRARTCPGRGGRRLGGTPLVDDRYGPHGRAFDFHLRGRPGSTAADGFVAPFGPDARIGRDYAGHRRGPGRRDAGASER